MNKIKLWFQKLFVKYFLPQHKFLPSTLIIKDGTRVLLEVEVNYYNTDMRPVTIARNYTGSQLFAISEHDILEYKEYKKMPRQTLVQTEHENDKFANYKGTDIGKE